MNAFKNPSEPTWKPVLLSLQRSPEAVMPAGSLYRIAAICPGVSAILAGSSLAAACPSKPGPAQAIVVNRINILQEAGIPDFPGIR